MENLEKLIHKYKELKLDDVLDYTKFNLISISHHSTKIEGSTLTEIEAQVLLNDGLTPKGKPLNDSLMVKDHFDALIFVVGQGKNKRLLSLELIQEINAHVMKSTGNVYNTILGQVDASKGMFRKGNVSAGVSYFPNYDKVILLTTNLIASINDKMNLKNISLQEKINLSFDAHYHFVSIHPFYDGNGRTSRLLMNYILSYFNLPLTIVNSENKQDYIEALVETRNKEELSFFRNFMKKEYSAFLIQEIEKFQQDINTKKKKGYRL